MSQVFTKIGKHICKWYSKTYFHKHKIDILLFCIMVWGFALAKINIYIDSLHLNHQTEIGISQFITSASIFLPMWWTKPKIISFTIKLWHLWMKALAITGFLIMILGIAIEIYRFNQYLGLLALIYALYLCFKLSIKPTIQWIISFCEKWFNRIRK